MGPITLRSASARVQFWLLTCMGLFAFTLAGCGEQREPSGRSEVEAEEAPELAEEGEEGDPTEAGDREELEMEAPDEAEPQGISPISEEEEPVPLGTGTGFQLREPTLGGGDEPSGDSEFRLLEPNLGSHLPGTILVPPAGQELPPSAEDEGGAE